MSLATRCSSCGTVFRVVQDQLKVSEGWVRCGRCNQVFNALSGLFDLDRESPPEWEPQGRDDAVLRASVVDQESNDASASEEEAPPSDPRLVDRIDVELFGARGGSDSVAPTSIEPARTAEGSSSVAGPEEGSPRDFVDSHDEEAPDFVRQAERAQRWDRPWVRAALAVLALCLLAALGGQVAHHFRDEWAARHPEAAPLLAAWCEAVGCRIGPPRHIDDVAVESTALSKAGGAEAYKLSIVLRNHGATLVATPAVDLTLTDASGQLIARRMLGARDFGDASDRMTAGGELTLQTVLTAGPSKITGYTVELFYP